MLWLIAVFITLLTYQYYTMLRMCVSLFNICEIYAGSRAFKMLVRQLCFYNVGYLNTNRNDDLYLYICMRRAEQRTLMYLYTRR